MPNLNLAKTLTRENSIFYITIELLQLEYNVQKQ
jgi:hypothetical protein